MKLGSYLVISELDGCDGMAEAVGLIQNEVCWHKTCTDRFNATELKKTRNCLYARKCAVRPNVIQ